jgi:peptidoglycan/xylan/chitin deacetylase (PgdA/CDA1 family)
LDKKKEFQGSKEEADSVQRHENLENPSKNQDGVQQQQIVQSHENLRKILQARWCAAAADNSESLRRNPSSKVFAELFLIP